MRLFFVLSCPTTPQPLTGHSLQCRGLKGKYFYATHTKPISQRTEKATTNPRHVQKTLGKENPNLLCLFLCNPFRPLFQNNFPNNAGTKLDLAESGSPRQTLCAKVSGPSEVPRFELSFQFFREVKLVSVCSIIECSRVQVIAMYVVQNKTNLEKLSRIRKHVLCRFTLVMLTGILIHKSICTRTFRFFANIGHSSVGQRHDHPANGGEINAHQRDIDPALVSSGLGFEARQLTVQWLVCPFTYLENMAAAPQPCRLLSYCGGGTHRLAKNEGAN